MTGGDALLIRVDKVFARFERDHVAVDDVRPGRSWIQSCHRLVALVIATDLSTGPCWWRIALHLDLCDRHIQSLNPSLEFRDALRQRLPSACCCISSAGNKYLIREKRFPSRCCARGLGIGKSVL